MPFRYCRADRALWRRAHGTVLVLPASGQDVLALTGAGDDLWRLLFEPMTIHQTARRLAEIYDRSPDEITREIAPILDDLVARGALNRMESA